MTKRLPTRAAAGLLAAAALVVFVPSAGAQTDSEEWQPDHLADGQPNIQGMWNNTRAIFTPLELPEDLAGREDISTDELQQRAAARGTGRIERAEWQGHENNRGGVGGYGLYWFDWYFDNPTDIGQPSIVVEPANGRIPERTADARERIALNMAQLHDSYANMESGDRCISRGVLGMMMPTEYNNGTLILQPPGYVVFHSEMIHNARIIPIDGAPHVDEGIRQWEGDPRGRWEGNTLVIESTNFRAVRNMRGPTAGTVRGAAHRRAAHVRRAGPAALLGHDGRPGDLHRRVDRGLPLRPRRRLRAVRVRLPRGQLLGAQRARRRPEGRGGFAAVTAC
ncbi:MAG: hypothetical protein J4G16_12700 [Acidobacteria bacterium]|nr:hypothetical protein [Acidobacteriota bacterium]